MHSDLRLPVLNSVFLITGYVLNLHMLKRENSLSSRSAHLLLSHTCVQQGFSDFKVHMNHARILDS